MTHSKNHLTRENSRCRKNDKCIYGFPQPITPETWIDNDRRAHYKRTTEDDRWIAPHIPELVDELDCHIYVDVVSTVSVFSYLYKYLHKGPDQTWFHISHSHGDKASRDEIIDYVEGRYLSSHESIWRILAFEIASREPSVTCLPIHLPGENIPRFNGGIDVSQSTSTSLLICYFHRPDDALFSNVLYSDYFKNYVLYKWNEGDVLHDDEFLEKSIRNVSRNKVSPRRKRIKVARLQIISPTAGEVFYLRCLLTRCPARSFIGLRTINGFTHSTFHEAALSLGLFTNENEGHFALLEAVVSYCTPSQLRFLFARIVLEGYPAKPLWDEFRDQLCIDYINGLRSHERGTDRALQSISDHLRDGGRRLADFGLPEPQLRSAELIAEYETYEPLSEQLRERAHLKYQQMNAEQKHVYDTLLHAILTHHYDSNNHAGPFFVEGKPGRGKTFVIDALCCDLRSRGLIILIVGTSALSATLYEGGRTAHNLFRIPVTEVSVFPSRFLPYKIKFSLIPRIILA